MRTDGFVGTVTLGRITFLATVAARGVDMNGPFGMKRREIAPPAR